MKNLLLILCALGYGLFPAIVRSKPSLFVIVLVPILLGMIYFVLHTKEWPTAVVPWLFSCVPISRIAGYWFLNATQGRKESIIDSEAWAYGGLAAICFAFMLYKWMRGQNESPTSADAKST